MTGAGEESEEVEAHPNLRDRECERDDTRKIDLTAATHAGGVSTRRTWRPAAPRGGRRSERSHYLLACEGVSSTKSEFAFCVFERAFEDCGCPGAIRKRDGVPFAFPNARPPGPEYLFRDKAVRVTHCVSSQLGSRGAEGLRLDGGPR
jgi:hypothetical protein